MAHALLSQVLVLVAINFLIATFNYGYLFWLPSAFESMAKLSSFETGVLYTLPYILAAVGMVMFSHHSDKTSERRKHVTAGLALSGALLLAGALLGSHWLLLSLVLICVSSAGSWGVLGPLGHPDRNTSARICRSGLGAH